jgi:uncharacterized protein (TIGR02996 family)
MEDTGFLLSMLDAPNDPAPRLAYADWLDENGQGQLAFVLRGALGCQVEPRGDGVFVGFSFRSGAANSVRASTPYRELTDRMARLAMGARNAVA